MIKLLNVHSLDIKSGEMAEWLKALPLLREYGLTPIEGSNPSLSAILHHCYQPTRGAHNASLRKCNSTDTFRI